MPLEYLKYLPHLFSFDFHTYSEKSLFSPVFSILLPTLPTKKGTLTSDRSTKNKIKIRSRIIHYLTCFPRKICEKFAQFELEQAPDLVKSSFSKWDKRTLTVVTNE